MCKWFHLKWPSRLNCERARQVNKWYEFEFKIKKKISTCIQYLNVRNIARFRCFFQQSLTQFLFLFSYSLVDSIQILLILFSCAHSSFADEDKSVSVACLFSIDLNLIDDVVVERRTFVVNFYYEIFVWLNCLFFDNMSRKIVNDCKWLGKYLHINKNSIERCIRRMCSRLYTVNTTCSTQVWTLFDGPWHLHFKKRWLTKHLISHHDLSNCFFFAKKNQHHEYSIRRMRLVGNDESF